MALLTPTIELIEIEVSDRVFDGTRWKQKALFSQLIVEQAANGENQARMKLLVAPYAVAVGGGYGQRLPADSPTREITLMADNNTAVDPATGALLYLRLNPRSVFNYVTSAVEPLPVVEFPAAATASDPWLEYLNSKPETLMLQGDAFAVMRDTQDVRIRALIIQHIQQADQMGRFA